MLINILLGIATLGILSLILNGAIESDSHNK
jgi:hypothetical protein